MFESKRDEFHMMRGDNYDVDIYEFSEMKQSKEDMKYFHMFDSDSSLEVTYDEYCIGISKQDYPFWRFGPDWFGIDIDEYKDGSD